MTPAQVADVLKLSLPVAQSALTAFLVFVGLGLVVFVEPPTKWSAVVQEQSRDWRPTLLAIGLAIAFVVILVFKPLGDIFALTPLPAVIWAIVTGLAGLWFVVLRYVWHWRLLERFVGA
jgi:predicted membrane channel-forming protein YqfA (hemolysin III family)